MPEPLDARLRDDAIMAEIEMTSALIIAASDATCKLSIAEIDRIIGVEHSDNTTRG